jgi:hypothetical protein
MGSFSQLTSISQLGSVSKLGRVSQLGSMSQIYNFVQGQQYEETLPRGLKIRTFFQKATFWNYVQFSPLEHSSITV